MLSFFIARKYFARALTTKATSTSLWLSLFVLFIGSLSLSLALSITHAFEEKVFAKLQGINAEAFIFSHGNKLDAASIQQTIDARLKPLIKGITEQSMHSIILNHNDQQNLVVLRAINPETEAQVTNLSAKCLPPHQNQPLTNHLHGPTVLMGKTLAKQLKLKEGDSVHAFVPQETKSSSRINLSEKTVTVGALFDIGIDEFDANTLFCSLSFFNEIFKIKSGVDSLLVCFNPLPKKESIIGQLIDFLKAQIPSAPSHTDIALNALKKTLPHLTVASWKELYPSIISAMNLEKYGIIGVILLFMLVALMNIISTLFTLVHRKQHDIALFQTLGMPGSTISNIFIWLGMGIVTASTLAGITVGATLSYVLETYRIIPLPDVYYVSYLPASTDPAIFIFVTLISLLMGFVTIFFSIRHIKNNSVLETLRHTS